MFKKVLFACIVLVGITSGTCFSQSNLDKKISIFAVNEDVHKFLEDVERIGGFTFTYGGSVVKPGGLVTIKATNRPIRDVLRQALGQSYVFTEIGSQVVITKTQVEAVKKGASNWSSRLETEYIIRPPDTTVITIFDTAYQTITDTSFVQVTDTLKVHDTIVVRKVLKMPASKKFKMNVSVAFTPYLSSRTKYLVDFGYSEYATLVDNSEEEYRGNLFGVLLDYPLGQLSVKTGVISVNLSKDISYFFQKEYLDTTDTYSDTISYWTYKTVLTYYKFRDGDTVEVPIIDSSQAQRIIGRGKVKKEVTNQRSTNIIRYAQLPVSLGYPIRLSKRNWITPVVSVRMYYLYYAKGYFLNPGTKQLEALSRKNLSNFMLSGGFSLQYAFRLHDYTMMYVEPSFNKFVTKTYKNQRVNEQLTQVYLYVGLRSSIFER